MSLDRFFVKTTKIVTQPTWFIVMHFGSQNFFSSIAKKIRQATPDIQNWGGYSFLYCNTGFKVSDSNKADCSIRVL